MKNVKVKEQRMREVNQKKTMKKAKKVKKA